MAAERRVAPAGCSMRRPHQQAFGVAGALLAMSLQHPLPIWSLLAIAQLACYMMQAQQPQRNRRWQWSVCTGGRWEGTQQKASCCCSIGGDGGGAQTGASWGVGEVGYAHCAAVARWHVPLLPPPSPASLLLITSPWAYTVHRCRKDATTSCGQWPAGRPGDVASLACAHGLATSPAHLLIRSSDQVGALTCRAARQSAVGSVVTPVQPSPPPSIINMPKQALALAAVGVVAAGRACRQAGVGGVEGLAAAGQKTHITGRVDAHHRAITFRWGCTEMGGGIGNCTCTSWTPPPSSAAGQVQHAIYASW